MDGLESSIAGSAAFSAQIPKRGHKLQWRGRWPAVTGLVTIFVIAGLGLSSYHISSGRTGLDVLFLGVIIMTFPVVWVILTHPIDQWSDEWKLLVLILLGSLFARYIFALTSPFIVGTDAPFHYFQTQAVLNGDRSYEHGVSGALPLLYLLYSELVRLTSLPLHILATWFHPLLNTLSVILFYVYFRSIVPARVALLSALLYAWEYTSFFFGFEFRTQSLAVVLFAAFLALRASAARTTSRRIRFAVSLISVAMLVAISLTALVSSAIIAILLAAMAIGEWWDSKTLDVDGSQISWVTALLVPALTISYLIFYASTVWDNIVPYLWNLISATLAFEFAGDQQMSGVYALDYGPFVAALQWLLRIFFIIGLGYHALRLVRGSKRFQSPSLFAAFTLVAILAILTPFSTLLSSGRYFQYLSPFYALYIAVSIAWLINRFGRIGWDRRICLVPALILSLWCVSGILKLPNGLIDPRGSTERISYRIDDNSLPLASQLVTSLPPSTAFICADETLFGPIYIVSGVNTNERVHDTAGAVSCAKRGVALHPDAPVVVAVDTSYVGDPSSELNSEGFRIIEQVGSVVLYVRLR